MNTMKIKLSTLSLIIAVAVSTDAAIVKTLKIPSRKMSKEIPATLILPDAYGENDSQRFPVLYLLHGAGDDCTIWNIKTDVAELADKYGVIMLCPDAGRTSWYFDSPIDTNYQYETFVAEECVEYLDKNYRTKADRQHRALCGNSMGGHGAMFLAIRHRDAFSISVPLSGGVDLRPFPNKWKIKQRIGAIKNHRENWEKNSVINLAKTLKDGDLAISIDCGDHDFFLKVNRALHKQLQNDGIKHRYIEKPGIHNWIYWKEAIKRQMPFITEQFNR